MYMILGHYLFESFFPLYLDRFQLLEATLRPRLFTTRRARRDNLKWRKLMLT